MTSSSNCFFFLVSLLVLLQFSVSALASTKYIDTICNKQYVDNITFCCQTLTTYPPAVAATSLLSLTKILIGGPVMSYAEKIAAFVAEVADHGHTPTLKTQFKLYKKKCTIILTELSLSVSDLTEHPADANYDIQVCYDEIQVVKELIGKDRDTTSVKLMNMILMMEKFLVLTSAATTVVGG